MSSDNGEAARFAYKVFDSDAETTVELAGETYDVRDVPAGRYQIKLLVAREGSNIKELWIQRVPSATSSDSVTTLLNLRQPEINRLVELLKALESVPMEGETSVRVDDSIIRDLFANPSSLSTVYSSDPEKFRELIQNDAAANDVVAQASRRQAVSKFKEMLDDAGYFQSLVDTEGKGSKERVWQKLFEQNPWMLGVSFSHQLLTSWDAGKLEQVVDGFDVSGPGKRVDALMQTAGRVRSMVFVEIKTHETKLLGTEYRSGCWPASVDLSGGIAQIQGTVHRAVTSIGERLLKIDDDGHDIPNDFTYLIRPPSLLLVGSLSQLQSAAGADHKDKIRSFELYRRSIVDTEIMTFDELYAKAKFVVDGMA